MKLLLTDVNNPLGRALEHELERETFGLLTPASGTLDWTDAQSVQDYLQSTQPVLVLNTLGWADSPDAEQCSLLVPVAEALGQACQLCSIPVIQFSSYRVFGGDNKSSHSERDEPNPQSDVGRAWLAAERALEASLEHRLILRLSWVVGAFGDNLLTRLLGTLFEQEPVGVSARLRGAPTALSDVARVVVGLAKQITCGAQNWGTLHYCSSDNCTQAEFADRVLEVLGQLQAEPENVVIERLESLPEEEPASAVLSCRRVRDGFGVQPRSWEPTLVPMIKQWLHQRSSAQELAGLAKPDKA